MGLGGLNFTPMQFPFGVGLNQKSDPRAESPPSLDIALDVQSDQTQGVQTRYPYAAMGSNILGGGTISGARKLAVNDGELLLFTATQLFSWSARDSAWVLKGDYPAIKVTETPVFETQSDQQCADRAELNGTVVYCWGNYDSLQLIVAAIDKTTGNVLLAPTQIGSGFSNGRVIALQTKILFLYADASFALNVGSIDPANLAASFTVSSGVNVLTNATLVLAGAGTFDATQVIGADQLVGASSLVTSYEVFTITAGLTIANAAKARASDSVIAVSCTPDGASVQVLRNHSTSVLGDLITISTLADVYTAQTIGTIPAASITQLACAHQSVLVGGFYRCYVFWDEFDSVVFSGTNTYSIYSNWVDTAGSIGTQSTISRHLQVASRAFDVSGRVFFAGVFNEASTFSGANTAGYSAQLQNTYFLYRDDGLLCGKLADNIGGDGPARFSQLPGVAVTGTNTYSVCLGWRRTVPVNTNGQQTAYNEAHSPYDVTLAFDSNEARRAARLGLTLYIPGAEVMAYDGQQLVECAFHLYPWVFGMVDSATAGGLQVGSYAYKETWRWSNAAGETERSTTATVLTLAIGTAYHSALSNTIAASTMAALAATHKTTSPPAVEMWRTILNPPPGAPFYLTNSTSPATTTNPNRYLANDPSGFEPAYLDGLFDTTLSTNQTNPENGGDLSCLSPTAATIIATTEDRVFLAGVAGLPDQVWYSRQRQTGEIVAFNDALTIDVPHPGGTITGLAFLEATLIVFRATSIYRFAGTGFDNAGSGSNYGLPQIIATDLGAVNAESIAIVGDGIGLIFKSSKGWYLLTPGWQLQYIGSQVCNYDSETPLAVNVVTAQHQVRCLSDNRMLVWDYNINQWFEWTVSDGLDAAMWNGQHVYLTSTGPKIQQTTYAGLTYGMDVETAWIKIADLQGRGYVRTLQAIGEYRSDHALRWRVARDYLQDGAGNWLYYDDFTWPVTPTVVGGPEQSRHGPSQKRCQAIKVRLTAVAAVGASYATLTISVGGVSLILTAVVSGPSGNAISAANVYGGPPYPVVADVGSVVTLTSQIDSTSATFQNIIDAVNAGSLLVTAAAGIGSMSSSFGVGSNFIGTLSGGATTPTGEACKLTGLALDVGAEPGLYQGLSTGQRI